MRPTHLPVLLAGLVILGAAGAAAQEAQPGPLEEAMSYYLRGSWAWRQMNPEYESGGEAPRLWIREYEWGPGRNVLLFNVYAVRDGDACEAMLHGVLRWDVEANAVTGRAYGLGGQEATLRSTAESSTVTMNVVEGFRPDGSPMRMRDRTDHSHEEYETVAAEMWRNGEWTPLDTARWELAPARICS